MTIGPSAVRQSGSMPFRARARLIRLLGEELISDEVMAVVELIKNGYDADAQRVAVTIENTADPSTGRISIRDDGYGMDLQTILYGWMDPATPRKRARDGSKIRTPMGRVQLGEKGVGRFAADKLGSELELVTRPPGSLDEIVMRVGWHHYDHDRYLDEVENTWFTREPVEFPGEAHGTLLLIHALRARWDQDLVGRLYNGLARLVSPAAGGMDFVIDLHCPDFPLANGQVVNRLVESAPYRLAGRIETSGVLHADILSDNTVDLRTLCHGHFVTSAGELRMPECGPFGIALNIWDLEPLTGRGFGVDRGLRESIKAASGVSIYRDGFRVWPYGEKDDDWLELNQRRVNNPTLRISNNQIIGYVEITHADNSDLRDRTSREGLVDTPAFFDLKALVLAALSVLETARFARRRELIGTRPLASREGDDEVLQSLARVRGSTGRGDGGPALRATLKEVEQLYRARLAQDRTRYDQVSRLAGVGMAAELLTDAFSREILNAVTLLRILQGESRVGVSPQIQSLIRDLAARMETVNEQLDMMAPLYRPSMQANEPVSMRGIIYDVASIFAGRLVETGTRLSLVGQADLTVRLNRGHLMQILMILIQNALQAMGEVEVPDPYITIELINGPDWSGLRVADSGPGVPVAVQGLIFEPYFSTRQAGRGLGLHVARDILAGYNSTIQLVTAHSPLPGACFEVRFDGRRLGSTRADGR